MTKENAHKIVWIALVAWTMISFALMNSHNWILSTLGALCFAFIIVLMSYHESMILISHKKKIMLILNMKK